MAQPYGAQQPSWVRSWLRLENQLKAAGASAVLMGRFHDCMAIAYENDQKYEEPLRPLQWEPDAATEWFVDDLSRDIRKQVIDGHEVAWNFALRRASEESERQRLQKSFERFQEALRKGNVLFRPDEHPSATDPQIQALQDDFAGHLGGIAGHWNKKHSLGQGGYGQAVLWIKYNAQHQIIDRIVLKDTKLKAVRESGQHEFDDQKYWFGPLCDRVPLEAAASGILKKAENSYHIVECRGWAISDIHRTYRLYLEFCPHGDLGDMLDLHSGIWWKRDVDEHGNQIDPSIPERALWAIFEALASAICILQDGCLPGGQPSAGARIDPLIHCDIKPVNVFLGEPHDEFWPGIPVPKLGDFGLAMRSRLDDPPMYGPGGTEGFRAPEQYQYIPLPHAVHASDIWGIGKTMLSLVNLDRRPDDQPDSAPRPTDAARNKYSVELLRLISECTRRNPHQRISARQLFRDIRDNVLDVSSMGLRDHPLKTKKPKPEDEIQLAYKPDRYKLWVAPR